MPHWHAKLDKNTCPGIWGYTPCLSTSTSDENKNKLKRGKKHEMLCWEFLTYFLWHWFLWPGWLSLDWNLSIESSGAVDSVGFSRPKGEAYPLTLLAGIRSIPQAELSAWTCEIWLGAWLMWCPIPIGWLLWKNRQWGIQARLKGRENTI